MTTTESRQTTGHRKSAARLTVIMETMTHEEYGLREIDFPQTEKVFHALDPTGSPFQFDVLIMADKADAKEWKTSSSHPEVQVVPVADPSYYTMKNAGVAAATTEYVAFLDGDCMPGPDWADIAVTALDGGADVVAGKTRYAGPGVWAKLMGFFDHGTVTARADGTSTGFHLNNVAFRRDVYLSNPLDTRFRRTGACVLANLQLRAANRRIVYEPTMTVTHGNDWKQGFGLAKRLRAGHNVITLIRYDDTEVVPYRWVVRLGPAAAPLIAGRRIWDDLTLLIRQHEDLGFPVIAIPFVWLIAIPLRLLEGVGYVISCVNPSIIGKYWD